MPHLVHLTSLILLDVDDPFSGNHLVETGQHSNPDVLALFKERKRYGSCTKDIWNALTAARVRLEKIVIDNIPQSFLDYLLSYSGLKKLCLIYPGSVHSDFSDGKASDAMAALLFEQSLSNHARSLENLNIYAAWEGLWCFGGHNRNAISNLTKLKNLGMSVRSSDLWNYRDKRKDKNSLPKRDPIVSALGS
uniref:Uncharacterized protein n=1 Tax=Psilocybe cubensis TaxID=181762 RepID=A0A8H8CGK0_PSICU